MCRIRFSWHRLEKVSCCVRRWIFLPFLTVAFTSVLQKKNCGGVQFFAQCFANRPKKIEHHRLFFFCRIDDSPRLLLCFCFPPLPVPSSPTLRVHFSFATRVANFVPFRPSPISHVLQFLRPTPYSIFCPFLVTGAEALRPFTCSRVRALSDVLLFVTGLIAPSSDESVYVHESCPLTILVHWRQHYLAWVKGAVGGSLDESCPGMSTSWQVRIASGRALAHWFAHADRPKGEPRLSAVVWAHCI